MVEAIDWAAEARADDAHYEYIASRLIAWMEHFDRGGQLKSYSAAELVAMYFDNAAHDANAALQRLKMQAMFETIAEQLENETGDTVMVMLTKPDIDRWRVVLHTEQQVVMDLSYAGARPLNFSSVDSLLSAIDQLITMGVAEWFKRSRARARRHCH